MVAGSEIVSGGGLNDDAAGGGGGGDDDQLQGARRALGRAKALPPRRPIGAKGSRALFIRDSTPCCG